MEFVTEYLTDLVAFVKQETKIANTGLFVANGDGLSCIITPEAITPAGPPHAGRELRLTVRLSAPIGEWQSFFQNLAKLDKMFTNLRVVPGDLKLHGSAVNGGWSRVSDPSSIVFVLSLTLLAVRQGA